MLTDTKSHLTESSSHFLPQPRISFLIYPQLACWCPVLAPSLHLLHAATPAVLCSWTMPNTLPTQGLYIAVPFAEMLFIQRHAWLPLTLHSGLCSNVTPFLMWLHSWWHPNCPPTSNTIFSPQHLILLDTFCVCLLFPLPTTCTINSTRFVCFVHACGHCTSNCSCHIVGA